MRKGSELIGRPIVAYDTGEQFATIREPIFDPQSHLVLGFVVHGSGFGRTIQVLPIAAIQALGPDAAIVSTREVVVTAERAPGMQRVLRQMGPIRQRRVMTADGALLGRLSDVYFHEESGAIEGYEVRSSTGARSFLPASLPFRIGRDVLFAHAQSAGAPFEREPAGASAPEREAGGARSTAPIVFELEEQQASGAVERSTLRLQPEEDYSDAYRTAKLAHCDVRAADGTLIIRKGEQVSEEVMHRAERHGALDALYSAIGGVAPRAVVHQPSLEDAHGLRVQWLVRASRGLIVAAAGQVVTQQVIERARRYGKEHALLQAVGLLPPDEKKLDLDQQFDLTAQQARDGAVRWWTRLKQWFRSYEAQGAQQIEVQRTRRALGRPVTRVILDRQDQIILNVGDLITNQAIERARQAGVLDLLLNSVYTKEPLFSKEELRAPVPATASSTPAQSAPIDAVRQAAPAEAGDRADTAAEQAPEVERAMTVGR